MFVSPALLLLALQQIVRQVSDLILWGDTGIALWAGTIVAPCIDDVYLFAPQQPSQSISWRRGAGEDLLHGYVDEPRLRLRCDEPA